VKWTIYGLSPAGLSLPASGYAAAAAATLDFAGRPEGELYPVTFTLEDQAGNTSVAGSVLRYNKAPAVALNASALTVRPGAAVRLEDLVSVTDDEWQRVGDYALTFTWMPNARSQTTAAPRGGRLGPDGTYRSYPAKPRADGPDLAYSGVLSSATAPGKRRYEPADDE
jgi:hypothetical protein